MMTTLLENIACLFDDKCSYTKKGILEVLETGKTEDKTLIEDVVNVLSDNETLEENRKLRLEVSELNRRLASKTRRVEAQDETISDYKVRLTDQSDTYAKNTKLLATKTAIQASKGASKVKLTLPEGYSVKEYVMLLSKLAMKTPTISIVAESSVPISVDTINAISIRHAKYINGLRCNKGPERAQYFDAMIRHFESLLGTTV